MVNQRAIHFVALAATAWAMLGLALPASAAAPRASSTPAKKPTLEERTAAYFAGRKDLRPGDLIVQSDITALTKQLAKEAYDIKPFDAITPQVVSDQSILGRLLRTPAGKQFARQSAQYPMGYDRLDHLSRLPDGANILQKLIDGPDGYKLIEYMTTAPGGTVLGQQLSESPTGKNFNSKTGKIYTADQLVAQLKENAKPKAQKRK